VLLATFASLRWGEVTALQRCDLDLDVASVRNGRHSASGAHQAGRSASDRPSRSDPARGRHPGVMIPALREHLVAFVKTEPDALLFPGPMDGPMRRRNFNRAAGWSYATAAIGDPACICTISDTPETRLAAATGAGLKDLMAWMATTANVRR
jgi:hypothetical protein